MEVEVRTCRSVHTCTHRICLCTILTVWKKSLDAFVIGFDLCSAVGTEVGLCAEAGVANGSGREFWAASDCNVQSAPVFLHLRAHTTTRKRSL